MTRTKTTSFFLIGILVAVFFQNCGQPGRINGFASENASDLPQGMTPVLPPANIDLGLKGGHFDLDTSTEVYDFNSGKTDHHVHEFDDKYNLTEADFLNLPGTEFSRVQTQVGNQTEFIITVFNAHLSPGAVLEINDKKISVTEYQVEVDKFIAGQVAVLPKLKLSDLLKFKVTFTKLDLGEGILVPTQTSCVVRNIATANGEYRNGALGVQVLDASIARLDAKTRAAAKGGGLLWEATLFWHKDKTPCL